MPNGEVSKCWQSTRGLLAKTKCNTSAQQGKAAGQPVLTMGWSHQKPNRCDQVLDASLGTMPERTNAKLEE
jgi:hypothetical protein